ncbi:uncharacterized protein LOC107813508 [Nicotiana tabacum]|uniref:Uncharacterized protein LOC107813508 n=1 Tax=Nicotiana tabacum TaxID=4097 RepID=A0A1S4BZM1_TOBAC|nr:uncharacterized protein LOC104112509 [Nicotiana tomentosiformis]XP_016494268.1 PREDICTED: uncharacterized protein LOC107813508 [Nicotiana tabacum]
MMPLLFLCSSYRSFILFLVIIFYFPNHSCIARKSLLMPHYSRLPANNKAAQEIYFGTDSSRVENGPRGIANLHKVKKIEAFHKEKNDNKSTISGTEMISPSSLSHARLLKALKTKGARLSAAHDMAVASQTGNKNLYRDIIEMDYDPPHRKSPIHN